MIRPRFNLLQLTLLIGLAAIALAFTRLLTKLVAGETGVAIWWILELGITPLLLWSALVMSVFMKGSFRAYLIGFASIGLMTFLGGLLHPVLILRVNELHEKAMWADNDFRYHLLLVTALLLPAAIAGNVGGLLARWWRMRAANAQGVGSPIRVGGQTGGENQNA